MSGELGGLVALWSRFLPAAVVQTTLVAGVVLVLVALGRRWPAPVRCGLLLLALVKFALPPTLGLSIDALRGSPAEAFGGAVAAGFGGALPVLLGIHIVGSLAVAGWLAIQVRGLSALLRCTTQTPDALATLLARRCQRLGLRRVPHLCMVETATAPFACGLLRPTVVLPRRLAEGLPTAGLALVLDHELRHLMRRDPWWNTLGAALAVLWWFHPAFWLVVGALRRAQEDCCDDGVLAGGAAGAQYGAMLLAAARVTVPPLAAAGLGTHPLGRRLERVMDAGVVRRPRLGRGHWLLLLGIGLLALPGHGLGIPPAPPAADASVAIDGAPSVSHSADRSHSADHAARHRARHRGHGH